MGVMRYSEMPVLQDALALLIDKLGDVQQARDLLYGDTALTRTDVEELMVAVYRSLGSVRNAATTARAIIQALDEEQFEEDEAAAGRAPEPRSLPAPDDEEPDAD